MEKYLLGIDVGTTSTKTLLIAEDGRILASAAKGYPMITPGVGRVEQSAEDWWTAVVETVRGVCTTPEIADNVCGIALSTQGGTVVPVDAQFKPLANAIVWNDVRCAEEKEEFIAQFGEETMYKITGWSLLPGLPALQLRRMAKDQPEIFNKAAMFLTVPDFISARLTGRPAVDLSNAGINQLTDITACKHDERLMAFAGVREDQLAPIVPSCEPVGKLTKEAAEALGLSEDVVVSGGAHDQYAVALGAGICEAGDAIIGSGTAWVLTALLDAPDFSSGFAQSISASKEKYGTLITILTGGVCLDWFRKNVAGLEGTSLDYGTINSLIAERATPGAKGLTFYPYFSGASLPKLDPTVKATMTGLDLSHDRCDVAQAIMEGVTYQIVWALQQMEGRQEVKRLKLAGGATKSPVWTQMIADVSGRPVYTTDVADLACVGAARMAGVGCGLYADTVDAAKHVSAKETVVMPNPENHKIYKELHERFKRNVEILKTLYA